MTIAESVGGIPEVWRQNWSVLSPNIATQMFLVPKRGGTPADHKTDGLYLFHEFDVAAANGISVNMCISIDGSPSWRSPGVKTVSSPR